MTRTLNLAGKTFGKITIRARSPTNRHYWLGTCECRPGLEQMFHGSRIASGRITHCGCERATHGHTANGIRSPTYLSWEAMRARCKATESIGADGTVSRGRDYDPRWNDFRTFLVDMGERPADTTLDRINPLLGYSKQNCRWASRVVQDNNKTNSKQYIVRTLQGQHFGGTALDWAEWFTRTTGVTMSPDAFRTLMRFLSPEQLFCALHPHCSLDDLNEWGRVKTARAEAAARAERERLEAQQQRAEATDDLDAAGYVEDAENLV